MKKSKEDLIKALSEPKPETKPETKPKKIINKKKLKKEIGRYLCY